MKHYAANTGRQSCQTWPRHDAALQSDRLLLFCGIVVRWVMHRFYTLQVICNPQSGNLQSLIFVS